MIVAPRVETSAVVAAVAASNTDGRWKIERRQYYWRRFFLCLDSRPGLRAYFLPAALLKSPAFTIENFAGTR